MNLAVGIKGWKDCKNILDLAVPKELEATIKVGIAYLDDAFGNGEGLTPSTSVLLSGTPGAGKTTIALQMADSLTRLGNIVLFNSCEESLYQVRKVAKRLGLTHGFYAGQDTRVDKILAHCDKLRKKHPGKQLILMCDSLQTLDDGKYANGFTNSMTQVRATTMITDYCKEHFVIGIIICQVTKSGEFAGKQQVKHIGDVHAHIYVDDKRMSDTYGKRIFEVRKNRFGSAGKGYILDMRSNGLCEEGSFTYTGE